MIQGSGDGTRPTTSGGVDNIGGADSFQPGQGGAQSSPAPAEKMGEKRRDKEAAKHVDSAAFGLRESPESAPNTEPEDTSTDR